MYGRLVSLLAVLAMIVVTMMAPVHGARVGALSDHSGHSVAMAHAADDGGMSCADPQDCAASDARTCASVCAGLAVVLTLPAAQLGQAVIRPRHALPAAAIRNSRAPALQDRPPKPRLL